MALDVDKVEAILRQHWQIPSDLSRAKLQEHAGRIHVLVRQKYSHDNLKYQLGLIQTTKLHQDLDDQACDQIAADLLKLASRRPSLRALAYAASRVGQLLEAEPSL